MFFSWSQGDKKELNDGPFNNHISKGTEAEKKINRDRQSIYQEVTGAGKKKTSGAKKKEKKI